MAKPRKTGESPKERFVTRTIQWPVELWNAVETSIPKRERPAFIRRAVKDALLRKAAERLRHYYATDPETIAWAEFVADDQGE